MNQPTLKNGAFTRTYGAPSADTWPRFFLDQVLDVLATERSGFEIYKDEERIELNFPGNPYSKPVSRVTDEHRQRWPQEYDAFKKGQEVAINGTPIDVLPFLKPAMVRTLKALDIMTAEQLAALNDHGLQRIPMGGRRLKELAESYLDSREHMAAVTKRDSEIDKLSAENAALKLQVESQGEQMRQLWEEFQRARNAPNAMLSTPPAAFDPIEQMKVGRPLEVPASSPFDGLPAAPRKRKEKNHVEAQDGGPQ